MAWTTPRTFVTGEVETAAIFNTHLRDNLNAITGATATYGTAATVWTGSSSNPVIGNGTFVSTFRQDAKWFDAFVQITMGSTTTFGTGTWQLALPATARFTNWGIVGRAIDSSVSTTVGYDIMGDVTTTTLISLRCAATAAAGAQNRVVSSANPITWATGDILTAHFRQEAA